MKRALVVDDRPESLDLLRALFQGHGWEVLQAQHGAEALALARQTPPDIAVTDLLMPVMDGYTLLRQWKADPTLKAIPLVVYTATYTDPRDEELALELGADAFIFKPAEPAILLARLDQICARAEAGQLPAATPAVTEEPAILREYSEALVRRLEDKTRLLELANQDLREREERLRRLADAAFEGIVIHDQGRILDVNRSFCVLYQCERPDEVIGKSVLEIAAPESRDTVRQHFQSGSEEPYEAIGLRKDGTRIVTELRGQPLVVGGRTVRVVAVRDITTRKEAEARVEHLTRLYATLSQVNQTIVRVKAREELFPAICRAAVEHGRMALAWIGLLDRATGIVAATAVHGAGAEQAAALRLDLNDGQVKAGLISRALATGRLTLSRNIQSDPTLVHMHPLAEAYGLRAAAAVPFRFHGAIAGFLILASAEVDYFAAPDLQSLISGMATDISFALDAMEADTQRQRATQAEEHARALAEAVILSLPGIFYLISAEGRFVRWNRDFETVSGYTGAEIAALHPTDLFTGEEQELIRQRIGAVFAEGESAAEAHFTSRDGTRTPYYFTGRRLLLDGQPHLVGMGVDLSARRRAEKSLRDLAQAVNASGDVVLTTAPDGIIMSVNAQFTKLYGYTADEVVGQATPRILKSGKHPPEFYEQTWARWLRGETVRGELINRTKDGRLVEIETCAGPYYDAHGQLAGLLAIHRDIGARKRAEAESRLLQTIALGVGAARDLDAALAFVLRQVCDATGWAMGEVWLPSGDRARLECHSVWHSAAPGLEQFRQTSQNLHFAPGAGLPGRVWQTKQPEWVADLRAKPHFRRFTVADRLGLKAGVGVPVLAHGEVVLVLDFFLFKPTEEDARWVELVAVVGAQIGGLIERKQAEVALRENEEKFRSLFEHSLDGLLLTTTDGQVLAANPAACQMLGRSEAEICQLGRRGLVDENDPRVGALVEQRARTGHAQGELTMIRGDGSRFEVELSSSVFTSSEDQRTGIVIRDITVRKQAEAKLREAERFAVGTLASLSAHMAILDAEGRILAVNDRWRQFAAANPPVTAPVGEGANYLAVCDAATGADEATARAFAAGIRDVIAGRRAEFAVEYPCHAPTEQRWFTGRVTRFAGEGPVKVVVAHENITARKLAEAEVAASEARFRTLIENASDLVSVLDARGVIRFQGPSSKHLLGYPPEEMTNRSAFDWIHPDDAPPAAAAIQRALAHPGVPAAVDYRFRHRDGSWRTLESIGRSIEDSAGERILVVNSRDVTESRKLEDLLRQSQKMEAIGQLAGGVAHDFNNILAAMLMQTEFTLMEEDLTPTAQQGVQEIRASAERAANLTRQLLLFSRRQVLQVRDVDLNEIVTNLAKMLQRIIGEDVRLHLDLHPAPLWTRADPGMLDQVLMNLAVNARDAMAGGGSLRLATAARSVEAPFAWQGEDIPPGRYMGLRVTDSGHGIAPEVLPRIFEPFFTTKEVGKGTGLGLATVFGIVKQHRGWIDVESQVGQGTTLTVYFPAAPPPATADAAANTLQPPTGTETILLAEDDPTVRRLMQAMLTRHGYRVLPAGDGVEALAVWREHGAGVDLLLTDLVMPAGLSGQQLAQRLQADRPGLKVLFTSGYSAEIAGREMDLRPGDAFVQKPCPPGQLLRTVRHCLDAKAG